MIRGEPGGAHRPAGRTEASAWSWGHCRRGTRSESTGKPTPDADSPPTFAGARRGSSHEYGYSWLSVLAATETKPSGMAIHDLGLAGMIPRGPGTSRIYLQCAADDTPGTVAGRAYLERTGGPLRYPALAWRDPVQADRSAAQRGVDPMSYGRLYLLGDAAHIVPPMSAKGIHLALHDAEVFARAVIRQAKEGDSSLLGSYSQTCLPHVWNYQAFATRITGIMHNAGFTGYEGEFKKKIARAELQRQFASESANKLFSELTAGTNLEPADAAAFARARARTCQDRAADDHPRRSWGRARVCTYGTRSPHVAITGWPTSARHPRRPAGKMEPSTEVLGQ